MNPRKGFSLSKEIEVTMVGKDVLNIGNIPDAEEVVMISSLSRYYLSCSPLMLTYPGRVLLKIV